jgi:hypothetical protein
MKTTCRHAMQRLATWMSGSLLGGIEKHHVFNQQFKRQLEYNTGFFKWLGFVAMKAGRFHDNQQP